jgi:hypothetical protein
VIRNNIFAYARESQLQRTRVEDHLSFTFERNIVYYDAGSLFSGAWKDAHVKLANNLYFDARGKAVDFAGLSFAEWQSGGRDSGSLIADPGFVAPERHDFHLRPDSPAKQIGFQEFDYSQAGVYGDEAWRRLAASKTYPPFATPPAPPPLALNDTFESTPVGQSPRLAHVHLSGPAKSGIGEAIAVSDETAASGQRSLKITDAPGLKQGFFPFFDYDPAYKSGTVRAAFDLLVEPGVDFSHEWRDNAAPYRVGPSLQIKNGKLIAAGRTVVDAPASQWFHVEIVCDLTSTPDRLWRLVVTLPGEPPRSFADLKVRDAEWQALDWFGFSSNATEKTVVYLDNLELGLVPSVGQGSP